MHDPVTDDPAAESDPHLPLARGLEDRLMRPVGNSEAGNWCSPMLALMLAQGAVSSTWKTDGYVFPNAETALSDAIAAAPPWRMNLQSRRHSGSVNSVTFSPDGKHLSFIPI